MTLTLLAESGSGAEGHAAALQEQLCRIRPEPGIPTVEPGEVARLRRDVSKRGNLLGKEARKQEAVLVQLGHDGIELAKRSVERRHAGKHTKVTGQKGFPPRSQELGAGIRARDYAGAL